MKKLYLATFLKLAKTYYETVSVNLYQLLSALAMTRAEVWVAVNPFYGLLMHIRMDDDADDGTDDGFQPLYELTEEGPDKGIRAFLLAQGYTREELLQIQRTNPCVLLSPEACAFLLEYLGAIKDTAYGLIYYDFAQLLGPLLYGSLSKGVELQCDALTSLVGASETELASVDEVPDGDDQAAEEESRRARIEEARQSRLQARSEQPA